MLRSLLPAADGIGLVSACGPARVGSGSHRTAVARTPPNFAVSSRSTVVLPLSSPPVPTETSNLRAGRFHLCLAPDSVLPPHHLQPKRRAARSLSCSCRSPAKTTDGRPLRLAGVHRRLQLWRARLDAGVVHFAARERRVGEVRHPVGADALGPVQPRLLLGGGELLAGGIPRRRQGLDRPGGPLGTQPSSGQFRRSGTRSLRSGVCTGSGKFGTPWLRMHWE